MKISIRIKKLLVLFRELTDLALVVINEALALVQHSVLPICGESKSNIKHGSNRKESDVSRRQGGYDRLVSEDEDKKKSKPKKFFSFVSSKFGRNFRYKTFKNEEVDESSSGSARQDIPGPSGVAVLGSSVSINADNSTPNVPDALNIDSNFSTSTFNTVDFDDVGDLIQLFEEVEPPSTHVNRRTDELATGNKALRSSANI